MVVGTFIFEIYIKSQSQTPENTASTAGWNDFVVGVRTKNSQTPLN